MMASLAVLRLARRQHPASADSSSRLFGLVPPCALRLVPSAAPVSHKYTTLVDGYLGMNNDEERSEMRYVVRIAEFSESSKL